MRTTAAFRRLALGVIIFCAASLHAQQTTTESQTGFNRLFPSFGRVLVLRNYPVTDGHLDETKMELGRKLEKLAIQLLDLGKESSSFARLPEMVQQVSTWQPRPECFSLDPQNSLPLADVQNLLGKQDAAATHICSCGDIGLVWHHYGVYGFGVTNDIVREVRITFPTPVKIQPDKKEK